MVVRTPFWSNGTGTPRLPMFSWITRIAWIAVSFVTIWSQLAPRSPALPPVPYYCYTATKAALFCLIGFLSPLTFWRFDSLGLGLLFSAVAAGAVEAAQSVSEGHQGSYFEFAAKLVLLFLGFAYGLRARYDRALSLGPLHLGLVDAHRGRKAFDQDLSA